MIRIGRKALYLALWFPFLPTDRLLAEPSSPSQTPPDAPLVLHARQGGALRLVALDAAAARLGLAGGMTLADARARHPDLAVQEHDPAADALWLEQLGQDCIRFTPHVTLLPPDGIGLDITGTAHLFGDEAALAELVEDHCAALGLTVRSACAGTLAAARALARHAPLPITDEAAAIRALPVSALGLDAEATRACLRAGLKTVGDLAARPAASIAARFGMAAVTALHRLSGEEQAPSVPLAAETPLHFTRRFAEPVAHQDSIAAALAELLDRAVAALRERGHGGRAFRLELHRSDGAVHALDVAAAAPTRDPARIQRLFAERIGALADPLDPGFGYDSITLAIPAAQRLDAAQAAFADAGEGDPASALAELVEQLSTRLGPGRIRRLVAQDSHIPEQAQLALPALTHPAAPLRLPPPAPGEPPLRPLLLFDPPQPVEVIAEVPDGPPLRFRWQRKLLEVRRYEGPERIAAEWWRRRGGEAPGHGGLTRDYYRVEDQRGRRFWIFRHGLYAERADPRWFLHGLFA